MARAVHAVAHIAHSFVHLPFAKICVQKPADCMHPCWFICRCSRCNFKYTSICSCSCNSNSRSTCNVSPQYHQPCHFVFLAFGGLATRSELGCFVRRAVCTSRWTLCKGLRQHCACRELAECKFAEYPIDTYGKATLGMAPLFSSQWSNSQDSSQSQSLLQTAPGAYPRSPGSGAMQFTQAAAGMVRATVGASVIQSASLALTLPREDFASVGFTQGISSSRSDTLAERTVVRRRFDRSVGLCNCSWTCAAACNPVLECATSSACKLESTDLQQRQLTLKASELLTQNF